MAAHAVDIDSPSGATPNGVHEGSSAEASPTSSRISSESPSVTPTLKFDFAASLAVRSNDESSNSVTSSPTFRRFSEVDELDDLIEDVDVKPDISSLDATSPTPESSAIVSRRPRGRPRKHPKPEQTSLAKKPMGRSKTGCITCRRRKKKCDERKPTCMHCEKNNVQCEGYHPKDIWQSGKQKALARNKRTWRLEGPPPLPSLIPGIEEELDWLFFEHFHQTLSNVLSIHPEANNPFRDHLLPMAQSHRGLMHSLLSLSGTHLIFKGPSKIGMTERSSYHFHRALKLLHDDESMNKRIQGDRHVPLPAPTVFQVVVLCLHTIAEGNTTGHYVGHLSALKSMLQEHIDTTDEEKLRFLSEFLIYHDMSAAMTSRRPTLIMSENFQVPSFIADGAKNFLGVCNGLFGSTSKTRALRDRVRKRRDEEQRPYVDFNIILDGKSIDADLKSAECSYDVNSEEWIAWNLYKTTFWLYLHRTLNNSIPSHELENGVDEAIKYLQAISPNSSVQSVLLTPIFIVACAAFNPRQRPEIIEAFDTLERYSSLGNIQHARLVVDKIWAFMDNENERSWDWEGIMEEMGMNFLVT